MQTKIQLIKAINTDEATKKKLYLLGIQENKVITIFKYSDNVPSVIRLYGQDIALGEEIIDAIEFEDVPTNET